MVNCSSAQWLGQMGEVMVNWVTKKIMRSTQAIKICSHSKWCPPNPTCKRQTSDHAGVSFFMLKCIYVSLTYFLFYLFIYFNFDMNNRYYKGSWYKSSSLPTEYKTWIPERPSISISNTSAAITTEIMTHSTWAMSVNNTEHIVINA